MDANSNLTAQESSRHKGEEVAEVAQVTGHVILQQPDAQPADTSLAISGPCVPPAPTLSLSRFMTNTFFLHATLENFFFINGVLQPDSVFISCQLVT